MLKIIPSKDRFFSDMGNMNSYFLFSFAHYYDPDNQNHWNLRVFNDDFLEWNSWFDFHPHKYYEIMTIMLDWTITHKDSLWNNIKVTKNQIQVTDTSTWIKHSELNEENESLKLYQVWFSPDEISPKPIYYTSTFTETDFENNLFTLASWLDSDSKNKLTSKVSVKRWVFDEKKELEIEFDRYVFLYLTSWKIRINWEYELWEKDQLRAFNEKKTRWIPKEEIVPWGIKIEFLEKSDFILIESE